MNFNFKKVVLSLVFVSTSVLPMMAGNGNVAGSDNFDWDPVIDAIIMVESRGNEKAVNGKYCGCLQMSPGCVEGVNKILKKQGINKRYSLMDRFSMVKAREMFKIYQSYYNPNHDVEKAIRSWNGGQGYTINGTNRYYRKVLAYLNK